MGSQGGLEMPGRAASTRQMLRRVRCRIQDLGRGLFRDWVVRGQSTLLGRAVRGQSILLSTNSVGASKGSVRGQGGCSRTEYFV